MMSNESTYWYAFQRVKLNSKRKNEIIARMLQSQLNIRDIFELSLNTLLEMKLVEEEDFEVFDIVRQNLSNISFLTEDIENQGYHIISILSQHYPEKYKIKLKSNAPPVLFMKGNLELLNSEAISIVGSRKASNISLEFTQNIAKTAAITNRTVVSGGASGVDTFASHTALDNAGSTIIILAEGVKNFKGYRDYYKGMIHGQVLFISSFDPDDQWQTFKAQDRNPLIYALGDKVFIAESGEKGGTINGALHALKEHWEVFIRLPVKNEINANLLLIKKGCKPVDMRGKPIESNLPKSELEIEKEVIVNVEELLKMRLLTIDEILKNLKLNWKGTKLLGLIKRRDNIISFGGKPAKYGLKNNNQKEYQQGTLF
jgi:DNA processing protein